MAPELALKAISNLKKPSIVLDPMTGSGTVIRQASDLGHQAIGLDMDPLAVLMSRVWTTPVQDKLIEAVANEIIERASSVRDAEVHLPWIDEDAETQAFVKYWFGRKQTKDLRRLAYTIRSHEPASGKEEAALNILRIALSRLIIAKENGASLARDVSHSRPHRVTLKSDYDVMANFERSVRGVRARLAATPPRRPSRVSIGDARNMLEVADSSVDAVLTSPPYLNAIDYLRGHRLSLVWLGYRIGELRSIRSNSIGAERAPDGISESKANAKIRGSMGELDELPTRFSGMIDRYVNDLRCVLAETARVLKVDGTATFVVGNSCLRGVFIRNSNAVVAAAKAAGLVKKSSHERELPAGSRYLPMMKDGALAKRMRTETILTFTHA